MTAMQGNESLVQKCLFLTFNTEDIDQVRHIYIIAASLDAILILPTILLNILLIISLYRSPQLKKPCTKLLYSLAASDVLVGMVIEPSFLTKKVGELQHAFKIYCYTGMTTYIAGGALANVSFFTHLAIALDRCLVVHSGTEYRTIVTNTRVTCLIIAIWSLSITLHPGQLLVPRSCYFMVAAVITISGVAMASMLYIKCVMTLRKQKLSINSLFRNPSRQKVINTQRYRRTTYTLLYVFLVYNICYLPYFCTAISAGTLGQSTSIWGAESLSVVLIYTSSFANPVILFCRMKEIGNAVAMTMSMSMSYLSGGELLRKRDAAVQLNTGQAENVQVRNV